MLGLLEWQEERETASLAFFAFRPDPSTVQLDHSFSHGEPQPHASVMPCKMGFHLEEAFKDAGQIPGRDADAIIHHGHFEMPRLLLRFDRYTPTRLCKLKGIFYQVAQGYTEFYAICIEMEWRLGALRFESDIPRLCFLLKGQDHILDDLAQRNLLIADARRARLNVIDIRKILNDGFQLRCVANDHIQLLAVLRACQFAQERGMTEDQS